MLPMIHFVNFPKPNDIEKVSSMSLEGGGGRPGGPSNPLMHKIGDKEAVRNRKT